MTSKTMTKSNIGYRGIGADGKPVEWYYAWNPGGFGCSANCDGCWARAMAKRLSAKGCPECLKFLPHIHPERFDQPDATKKPGVVLVNFTCDIADKCRQNVELATMWDLMWRADRHTFVVLTKQHKRLADWIAKHAGRRGFEWTELTRHPMYFGECISMDDIRMRDQCGHVGEGDWVCDFPGKEDRGEDNSCDECSCPIASEVDDRETLTKMGLESQYTFNDEGYTEDHSEWMQLHSRPLNAAARNVWVGFTARTQKELLSALVAAKIVKNKNPYAHVWLSLEPLSDIVTFNESRYPDLPVDEENDEIEWLKHGQTLTCGSMTDLFCPFIDGVIVGQDNRRGAPGTNTLHNARLRQATLAADVS